MCLRSFLPRRSEILPSRSASLRAQLFLLPILALTFLSSAAAQTAKPPTKSSAKPKPAPQAAPPDTLQQHYDAARTFAISGDQANAAIEYKAYLAEALRRTANARTHQGNYAAASTLFQDAIAADPADAQVRLDYAVLCIDKEDIPEAKAQSEKAVQLAPDQERTHYMLGRVLYAQGDYAGAKAQLETAIVSTPTFEVGYNLALTYLNLKDLNRTRLLFDEMITGLGDSAQLHVQFGHAYWRTGYPDKAIEEFKRALAKNPKIAQAHYFLGLAYLDRDEDKGWDEAAQEQREEIKNNPNDFRAHYELGNIALKRHNAEEAERELKRASELAPDNPDPLIYLGELYAGQSRPEEAEAAMRKAIALTTDPARGAYQIHRAHYVLGRVLIQSGRKEEGAKELKISAELREHTHPEVDRSKNQEDIPLSAKENQVHSDLDQSPEEKKKLEAYLEQLKPGIADAYNNLGVAAAGQKDFSGAFEYFRKAAKWEPALPTLDRNLGMAAFYAGQYGEAVAPLFHHLEAQPDDIRARAALALCYFGIEKYSAVLETLQPLSQDQVATDPGLGLAYAVSLAKTGKYDEGMARLKVLEQANPDSAGVHVAIGEAYADQKLYGTAIDEYRKAIALDPNQARTHFLLGLSLMHEATQADAAQEFRTAVTLDPQDATAKYHLAYALIQMQQKDEGQVLLREVVAQDPSYADAFYQLGKLQLDQGDAKSAIANLETSAKLSPASDYIHYQLSMAYRRDSRADDAEREMQKYEAMKQHRRGEHEAPPTN
jgi:tetratricopeptide (TPR) repeat protein